MPVIGTPNSLTTALLNGLRGRCPNCGKGRLFNAFVKVSPRCSACGEEFYHHRADDLPAYLVIFIVGHLLLPVILVVETMYAPPYWVHAVIWLPAILGLAIGLLQPVKGVVVALQWSMGMHGFGPARRARMSAHAA